jgi:hypothetical protein
MVYGASPLRSARGTAGAGSAIDEAGRLVAANQAFSEFAVVEAALAARRGIIPRQRRGGCGEKVLIGLGLSSIPSGLLEN